MDGWQDRANVSVLVLSPEYLNSPYCRHEMERAVARDPDFRRRCVVPVLLVPCVMPDAIKCPNPLYVDLTHDADPAQWDLVLQACDAALGAPAPEWLRARDQIARLLERNQSVNLIVTGNPRWSRLVDHIRKDFQPDLAVVDLDRGTTASRRGLVSEILTACGTKSGVPPEPEDLVELDRVLSARRISKLALLPRDHPLSSIDMQTVELHGRQQ
jgi:nucleotide-binding universal stress UspA family protein